MKKIKMSFVLASFFAAAGLTYTIVALKNLPEVFDWNLNDEDENEFWDTVYNWPSVWWN